MSPREGDTGSLVLIALSCRPLRNFVVPTQVYRGGGPAGRQARLLLVASRGGFSQLPAVSRSAILTVQASPCDFPLQAHYASAGGPPGGGPEWA